MGSKTPEEYQQIPGTLTRRVYWSKASANSDELKPARGDPKLTRRGSSSADLDRGVAALSARMATTMKPLHPG